MLHKISFRFRNIRFCYNFAQAFLSALVKVLIEHSGVSGHSS